MLKFRSAPFEDEIEKATHENNISEDWSQIMLICDKATNFQDGAKYCLKAIMKRLYHSVPRVVLQSLTLLDACVKNCDRKFLLQVASSEFTNEVRKLLIKMHPSASDKLKELLQRWSLEEFKDDPELCIIPSLYYKLKSEGVEFPSVEKGEKKAPVLCTNPDGVSSQEEENDIIKAIEISLKDTGRYVPPNEYDSVAPSTKELREPFKVRALYDFDAAEDNELTIKTGEIILVSDNSNSSWWKGSNHRGEGLFPSSFVTEDLDFKIEEPKVAELIKAEPATEVLEDVEIKLDEDKIEKLINWLNDIDPTEETSDPEEMLMLEKHCYGMTPLIEENLQSIDNRMAKLNLVNEKIMAAFDLFHNLSDHVSYNQPLQYYPHVTNQHVIQFPRPQVTLPISPGTILQQPVQPSVPQIITTVPQSTSQTNNLPTCSTVQSTLSQAPQMPSTVNSNLVQRTTEVSQSTVSASSISTATSLPSNQAACNVSYVGGYCVPTQAIPYPVQYGPNNQHLGYIQTSGTVANMMAIPYTVPPMRPYFPVQYYYVSSNEPQQNTAVTTTSNTVSTESIQECSPKQTVPTTSSSVNIANSCIPVASTYSNDLTNLYLNSTATSSNVSNNPADSDATNGTNVKTISPESSNEAILKKNL